MRNLSFRAARLLRGVGAGTLAAGLALAAIGSDVPAANAISKVTVTGGYYWADQPPPQPPPVGQPLGNLPNPTVPSGDWAVAARHDESNMETFVHLDLSSLPSPGTASNFVLHLAEDAGSAGTATAAITVAPVHEYYGDDAIARPYNERPTVAPNATKVQGQRSTTGEWTWDVTALVTECLTNGETSCGMAVQPARGTFQANLVGPTAPEDPTGTRHPPYAIGDAASASTGSTTETTSGTTETTTFTDTGSGSSPLPDVTPSLPEVPVAAVPNPINTPIPPAAAPRVAVPVQPASTGGKPNKALPLAFFLAALGMVALLGSFMFALGEAGEPALTRTGTVFRTLDEWLAASGSQSKE
ncbi:MAG TPA: hypothetical protein VGO92_10320 [Acidimicrobiales bacterium]|jgi:hypothetical protein|nr:hypothetical protein [Acidimicrobiales bacterium]